MKTRSDLITDAFRKIGALGDMETPTAAQLDAGEKALRGLVQFLATKGMPIWKLKQYAFPMSAWASGNPLTIGPALTQATSTAPLKVISAQRRDNLAGTTIDMNIYTRTEYFVIPSLNIDGTPTHIYNQPKTEGTMDLYLWPRPNTYWTTHGDLLLDVQEQFSPLQFTFSTPDFPDYWEDAVLYQLATRLAPEYGLALPDRQMLKAEADQILKDTLDFGNEEGGIQFQPKYRV